MGFINFILNLLRMIFGGSKSAPSEEAIAAANGAQAKNDAAVAQASAVSEAKMSQAIVDAPKTQAAVVAELRKGDF